MKLIAFCVKGIEEIVADELKSELQGVEIEAVTEKCVKFNVQDLDFESIINLKTVDDICIYVAEIRDYKNLNHKSLAEKICSLNFNEGLKVLQEFRPIDNTFSLTVSLPSEENLKTVPFKSYLSTVLDKNLNKTYTEKQHENFDIRIFRDKDAVLVGLRLTKESIHHRRYKSFSRRGSLRPTVAAALVRMAGGASNLKLLDPFCGSGTILCEAFLKGHDVYGSDIDKISLEITKSNLRNLGYKNFENITFQDAQATTYENNSFDSVVTNLPWGKQIKTENTSSLILKALLEMKRVVKEKGSITLLTRHPQEVLSVAEELFTGAKVETLIISMVGQQPTALNFKL